MAPLPRGAPTRGHSAKSRLGGQRPSSLRPLVHERKAAINLSEAQPRTSGPSTLRSICRPQGRKTRFLVPFCRSDKKGLAGHAGETAPPAKHDKPTEYPQSPPSSAINRFLLQLHQMAASLKPASVRRQEFPVPGRSRHTI